MATKADDVDLPGYRMHPLTGKQKGFFTVWVNGNWRIIFRLPAFSRIVRNEIRKGKKFYFYDNGIRNAIIKNFQLPGQRTDMGPLWENLLISERLKTLSLYNLDADSYFWRTTQQQKIDYIEESHQDLAAWEFKWSSKARGKIPKTFSRAYPKAQCSVVTPENFMDFLTNGTE